MKQIYSSNVTAMFGILSFLFYTLDMQKNSFDDGDIEI
jgi:hypothetical protein